jgi:hypothetical protein
MPTARITIMKRQQHPSRKIVNRADVPLEEGCDWFGCVENEDVGIA